MIIDFANHSLLNGKKVIGLIPMPEGSVCVCVGQFFQLSELCNFFQDAFGLLLWSLGFTGACWHHANPLCRVCMF